MKKRKYKIKIVVKFFIFLIVILVLFSILKVISNKKNKDDFDYKCPDCNVILIEVTNLMYDHLGMGGYSRNTSPNIDKFAEESVVFENAFSPASWTLPSGISTFTSLYPFTHKVVDRSLNSTLNPKIITLADILRENGYKTAAFTGGFDYSPRFGLTNRFDVESSGEEHVPRENENSSLTGYGVFASSAPAALEWLKNNKDNEFFLFVQGFDVHCPYTPPQPFDKLYDPEYKGNIDFSYCYWTFDRTEPKIDRGRKYYTAVKSVYPVTRNEVRLYDEDIKHMVALYDGEINYVDSVLGEFLDGVKEMELSDNTIIILTSEHGDMFGKHGRFERGGSLTGTFYDDVVHVPLIIYHPKLKPKRVNGLAQSMDIMPTVLDFLSIPISNSIQGKGLLPLIVNNTDIHDFILGGSLYNAYSDILVNQSSRIEFVRSKEWKLIREELFLDNNSTEENYELYLLKQDPDELNDIYNSQYPEIKKVRNDLKEKLFKWLQQFDSIQPK